MSNKYIQSQNLPQQLLKSDDEYGSLTESLIQQKTSSIKLQNINNEERQQSIRLLGNETGRKLFKTRSANNSMLKQSVNTDDRLHDDHDILEISIKESGQSFCQSTLKKLKKCICHFGQNRNQNDEVQILDIKLKSAKQFQDLIHDNGKIIDKHHKDIWLNQEKSFIQKIKDLVIEPESKYLIMWEILNFFTIMFYFIVIPLEIFFWSFIHNSDPEKQTLHQFEHKLNIVMFSILFVDIFVYFNVAYYEKGFIQKDKQAIISHYLKSPSFWINILGLVVPINDMFREGPYFVIINIVFFLKITNLSRFNNKIIRILQLKRKSKISYQMSRLILVLFLIGHFVACLYFGYSYTILESHLQRGDKTYLSWLQYNNILNRQIYDYLQTNWWIAYGWTFYWAMTTLVSGGYGDIGTPWNVYEAIFIIFVDTFIYVSFAFFMNVIWDYISEYRMYNEKFDKQKNAINRYMKVKEIEHDLQVKIDAYMDYFLKTTREEDQEIQIIQKLAPKLQEDLIFDSNGYVLLHTQWIKANFSEQFLKKLAKKMEEINYMQGDLIIDTKNTDEEDIALYFVESGKVEGYFDLPKYNDNKGVPLGIYRAGDMFNTYQFVINQPNVQNYKALEQSTLYKIMRRDFIFCLEGMQEDKEKFFQIVNQVLFKGDLSVINYQCRMCDSKNHITAQCPEIVLWVDPLELVRKNQKISLKRNKKFQRKKNYFRALLNLERINIAQEQIKQKYYPENNEDETEQEDPGYQSDDNISDLEEEEEELDDQEEAENTELKKSTYNKKSAKIKTSTNSRDKIFLDGFDDDNNSKYQNQFTEDDYDEENTNSKAIQTNTYAEDEISLNNNSQFVLKKSNIISEVKEEQHFNSSQEEEEKTKQKNDDVKTFKISSTTKKSFAFEEKEDNNRPLQRKTESGSYLLKERPNKYLNPPKNKLPSFDTAAKGNTRESETFVTESRKKRRQSSFQNLENMQKQDNSFENTSQKPETQKPSKFQAQQQQLQKKNKQNNNNNKNPAIKGFQARKTTFAREPNQKDPNYQQVQNYINYQQTFNEQLMNNIQDILLKKNHNTDTEEYDQENIYNEQENTNDVQNKNENKQRNINFNIDKLSEFKYFQSDQNIKPILTQYQTTIKKLKKKQTSKKQNNKQINLVQKKSPIYHKKNNNNNNNPDKTQTQNISNEVKGQGSPSINANFESSIFQEPDKSHIISSSPNVNQQHFSPPQQQQNQLVLQFEQSLLLQEVKISTDENHERSSNDQGSIHNQ